MTRPNPFTARITAASLAVLAAALFAGGGPAVAQDNLPPDARPRNVQQPVSVQEEQLDSVDEIVTEEEAVLSRVNYKAPPESETAEPVVEPSQLRYASEIDMNRALSAVEEGLRSCVDLRQQIESRIGETYGSYSVHSGWLRAYNACVLQRHRDIRTVGDAIEARRRDIISGGADEGATTMTGMVDRLIARQSAIKLAISGEMAMVGPLFAYYNTGVRSYPASDDQ
ncbi:hypothetical protein [Aquisalinus flavus]|uniref:Uncharacterized protein n=1 Tax=Aquisalinus flavus TaxID=1526572 RepID=A0A8J2V682_9PROT|nr:hypothetical protein [Aquisalinus flavus]MBD0427475.1 hypothetical protein [Aquisalinus flavus]UNE47272.1 hypothetical protein FF099_03965 [Aquisalinus flavus]GGD01284.1 hypothetical protein GCM10011342_07880 [Aquisalinus flavus]